MTHLPPRNRARMLTGCGSAALALALAAGSGEAAAQGIQAEHNVVYGDASVFDLASPTGGTTLVEANTPTVVIDWTPFEDAQGNALDFLPEGNEAIFQNGPNVLDFAVLNRILPSTNGSVVVINGTVIGRIQQSTARGTPLSPFVAFYSPTGFLIGSTAVFDVGQLLLTTLDTTPENFDSFVQGGTLNLAAQAGSTARISIASGAQISSPAENGFFAVVAADVQMSGTALVNGSQAYVAGEVVNLRLSNGLFDIEIPVGTAAGGNVLRLDGTIGGPASTGGSTDNHVIYGVAAAQNDPISILLGGNIGFAPAQQAGIVNGEIILSANYDVAGRSVNGGSSDEGINARFGAGPGTGDARADIFIENVNASSRLTAVGSHLTRLSAVGGNSTVGGNLLLAGREAAEVRIGAGDAVSVAGNLLVSADVFGALGGVPNILEPSATGGTALIEALSGGLLSVDGSARVSADAYAGSIASVLANAAAQGGTARISADNATISIGSALDLSARAIGGPLSTPLFESTLRGGTAELVATRDSAVTVGTDLTLNTEAFARSFGAADAGEVYGGTSLVSITGSTLGVTGNAFIDASANGTGADSATGGALGDAGEARMLVEEGGIATIGGLLSLSANAGGGYNFGGTGGDALGGVALAITRTGGSLDVTGDFNANADANAGFGAGGGNASGGVAGAIAETGTITLQASASASANAFGGDAFVGNGERGGDGTGGTSVFRAEGTLTQTAALTVGNGINANADGFGGEGGRTDGVIRGGRGGDGRGGSASLGNQADANFVDGAYILAGGDNGTLTAGALSNASARGFGGDGGDYSTFDPDQTADDAGDGGNGFGGTAQIGTALLGGGDGSLGDGLIRLAGIVADVEGGGGDGGRDEGDGFILGTGNGIAGNGTGGAALVTAGGGRLLISSIDLRASGIGGLSRNGGIGQGGLASIAGEADGNLTAGTVFLDAFGQGGFGDGGAGGAATGGTAEIVLDDMRGTFDGVVSLTAIGYGGLGTGGNGGTGSGGTAFIGQRVGTPGIGNFNQIAVVEAHGIGGGAGDGATGGTGIGGTATVQVLGGNALRFNALSVSATGVGGASEGLTPRTTGGNGIGGTASIISLGTGSRIIVDSNSIGEFDDRFTGGAILAALGLGGDTSGGTGIGGSGTGGTILLSAAQGGSITLSQDPAADPFSPGANRLLAYGIGGDSRVDGGTGGLGIGGEATVEADGGTISAGVVNFAVYGEGGASQDTALAIGGGRGEGGARLIRITTGGTLTGEFSEGRAGGFGGAASGGRNGGDGATGTSTIDINGGTFNILGTLRWIDSSTGGAGPVGGNVIAKSGDVPEVAFQASNATIAFTPNGKGESGLVMGLQLTGGAGVTAGGNVSDGLAFIDIGQSTLTGGNIRLENLALGGSVDGQGGIGGSAEASRVDVLISGSTVGLSGTNVISSTAQGGGTVLGFGGNAADAVGPNGTVNVTFAGSDITIVSAGSAPGSLAVQSRAVGGAGQTTGIGIARDASLAINGGRLSVGILKVDSFGAANAFFSGLDGSTAQSGTAQMTVDGDAVVAATTIEITADAFSSFGGSATAGQALLTLPTGSTAQITASDLTLSANAVGGAAGSNVAGRFAIDAGGGSIDVGSLTATASGDAVSGTPLASQIIATGGASVRVGGLLNASALGNITLRTGQGGTIGNTGPNANDTTIIVTSGNTIETIGDGSTGSAIGGQSVTLLAGRSILLGGSVVSQGGAVSLEANRGGLAQPQPQASVITMAPGSRIDAGTGTVSIRLLDGATDPQRVTGAITLATISGRLIDVRHFGTSTGSNIAVRADGVLTASGSGRAIDLASLGGEVINLAGDAGLVLTGGGHYGIFAATPTGSQIGSFANYVRRYNVANSEAYDQLNPGGNFAAFRIAPVLTVSALDAARLYGNANPVFTASFAGFQPGDGVSDLTGAAQLTTSATALSGIGQYAINVALGTLLSEQGYQFAIGTPGVLTVNPRPITITADNLSRIYGNANPALTFTVGGLGLVNGDQLSGALATTAGTTTGVGNVAITQGTLAASPNYAVTFNQGILSITPRPITITADNLSRIYGNGNPALTFTVGGLGLVNGDQLSGALATTAGTTTGVGNVAITQGTLAASPNYAVTFNQGILSITPRPITITADNLSRIYGNGNPALTFTVGGLGLVNGDQLTGALATTAGATTGVGNVAITQGTLAASANYAVTFNQGILAITPRPITITADNRTRIYGDANPALTFTVGGLGLVNGDQLTGALATTAGATTGVGDVAITQGTLAAGANYAVTYNSGILRITPRPITITADSLSKLIGLVDPALTYVISGAGLVNGDQLTGTLLRDAGELVGSYAIRQGTLAASANYTVTYVGGTFTIDPAPTPPGLDNPTSYDDPLIIDEPPPTPGEEDDAFGMDFPEQPDAPLITGDTLLDDPVASGNDALVTTDPDDDDDNEEEQ
ncbi:MBG domain-containing protein [Erythrobacter colymbi]|uniref:MBG domain-containing protein n=1 Tax=Erythrobacter colymbi TaxID=1161202 RepID=UPI000A37262F|nr:MBG domain-containing protein [Erythrobacter colymbi]